MKEEGRQFLDAVDGMGDLAANLDGLSLMIAHAENDGVTVTPSELQFLMATLDRLAGDARRCAQQVEDAAKAL